MFGTVRKRGQSWQWQYYAGRGADGQPKYKSVSVKMSQYPNKKDAEAYFTRLAAQMSIGEYVEPSKDTTAQFLQRWLEEIKPTVKQKTYEWYRMNVNVHLIPQIGSVQLSKLTPLQIQAAYRNLLENGRVRDDGESLSAGTVRGVHRTLRRALGQAVVWGVLARNPADGVEQPRMAKAQQHPLTRDQVQAFLTAAESTGRSSLYLALLTTGMRRGEILGLRWQDVDLDRGVASIQQQVIATDEGVRIQDTPKTSSGSRPITLSPALVEALKEEQLHHAEDRRLFGPDNQDLGLIWHTPGGGPISPRNLFRQFKSLMHKAGLPTETRIHDLRHTHATLLLETGVHPKVVQERLGHSSIHVTMDVYSHVMPALQQKVAGEIDNIVLGHSPTKKK